MTNPLRIAVRLRSALLFALATRLLVASHAADAQTLTGTVIVHVTADSLPISGATIAAGTANGVTDRSGMARFTLPTGRRTFRVTPIGFLPESLAINVGVGMTNVTIALRHRAVLPDVFITSTRDGRRLSDEPTSVEVIDREALDEQIDRSPGTISELLARVSGVRMQPLSAGSGGEGIRIRGMPARYTKILSDGLPLYGATPEGQDPLQIPALDLERVEIIKGVTSALYGANALSGVVNLVSAPPTSPSQVVVNGSTREGSDIALFQTHTFSPQWAATLVAGRHYQNADDPDGDGWAEVNGYKRVAVRPRVYWSRSDQSSWFMTGGWTTENRRSGTFGNARLPDFNKFSDDADTRRADGGTVGRIMLDTNTMLTIRASLTREWRKRWYGDNRENDRRNTIFSDVAVTKSLGANVLSGGVAFERDQYAALDTREFSYRYTTPALFAEHTWTPESWFGISSGARLDMHSEFGDFVSPRVSILLRPSETWNARISRSTGVYAPTPLTDDTEGFGLSHIRSANREAEHATGWSVDVTRVKGALEFRGSAYRTVVTAPLTLRPSPGSQDQMELVNADEPSRTQGIDLYARYRMRPLRLTAMYSYIDATRPEIGEIIGVDFEVDTTMRRVVPLNPRHSVDLDLTYERENDRIIGVDVRFAGRQALTDTLVTLSQPYVTIDARLEKHIGPTILFVRGKNLSGVHQAHVLRSASGPAGQWSSDIWAPLDGRVLNAGLRMKY